VGETPSSRSALDAFKELIAGIERREVEAQRLADLIKALPARAQNEIRVTALYCAKNSRVLEVFRIPPQMEPELPFLVIPSSDAPGYGPYWAIPAQDFSVRCRCCWNDGEVLVTMDMLTGEHPPPAGYRMR
jgi:hypothetical protein